MYSVIDEGSHTAFHQQHKDEIGSINYLMISVYNISVDAGGCHQAP